MQDQWRQSVQEQDTAALAMALIVVILGQRWQCVHEHLTPTGYPALRRHAPPPEAKQPLPTTSPIRMSLPGFMS